jgi:hypothetical protein
VLQCELHAIDAVLSELHEFEVRADRPRSDETREREQSETTALLVATAETPVSESLKHAQTASSDASEGGMVLLEHDGGANDCVYDLAESFTGRIEEMIEVPLGAERSVGFYQAFDVGGNELRSLERSDATIPTAASVTRPSQSSENAPAASSNRPS